jgi:ATP-dependent RNA helicase RhlB
MVKSVFKRLRRIFSNDSEPDASPRSAPDNKTVPDRESAAKPTIGTVAPAPKKPPRGKNGPREGTGEPKKTPAAKPVETAAVRPHDSEEHKPPPDRPRTAHATSKPSEQQKPRNTKPPAASKPAPTGPRPDNEFATLEIDDRIVHATADLGFRQCTPVQRLSLPASLTGRDLLVQAQTGSGKTAAFLVTALQGYLEGRLNNGDGTPSVLVLAPTRELARQIHSDAAGLGTYVNMRALAVYGGQKFDEQQTQLRQGVDMVVATPGRLMDFMKRRTADLSNVGLLVIDEADRMLDMGFIPDVKRIVRVLPPREKRQTMMYSATLTQDVRRLASAWTVDPETVEIEPDNLVPKEVDEQVYSVASEDKLALLLSILEADQAERVLVFCNRRDQCDKLHRELLHYKINSALLTGDVPQKKREHVLDAFRDGSIRLIVATDVAGRGIHVTGISHVVNYDLPYDAEDYVHRIGRTGRAGVEGVAVSFACEEGGFVIPEIEEYIQRKLTSVAPDPDRLKLPHPRPQISRPKKSDAPGRRNASNNRRRRRRPRRS